MAVALGAPCSCPHARSRLERSLPGLDLLDREREGFSPELRATLVRQRGCHRGWQPGQKLQRLVEARSRPNATLTSACAAGRIGALVLCSQQRLLRRDYVGVLRNLEEANALVPFASHCLERLSPDRRQDPDGPLSREEVYDNFRSVVRALGSMAMRDEDEETEEKDKGFFQQPVPEKEWLERIPAKINEEKLAALRWRSRNHPDSNVYFAVPPVRSAGAPQDSAGEDKPCGLRAEPPAKEVRRPVARESRARQLSASGCAWLLENACTEDRRIVLFAREKTAERLPKKLLGCGEFGNFEFNAVEIQHPAGRFLYPRNSTKVDTLLIIPGLMSGVSLHNPFHLLHSTVPVTWQLHHPDYGLCVPRSSLDIRMAFLNAFHARRQVHFWKVFSKGEVGPDIANMEATHVHIPSQWRFWWGPLADMPPLPLGADEEPRCYDRIIFGRELFRTGLGGFVTSRVVSFYHHYLGAVFKKTGASRVPSAFRSFSFGGEFHMFQRMQPDPLHREDAAGLQGIGMGSTFDVNYFSPEGLRRLGEPPALVPLDKEVKQKLLQEADVEQEVRLLQSRPTGSAKRIHVLWVQRPRRASRWIANMDEVATWIDGWRHPTAPQVEVVVLVAHFERLHPAAQFHLARQADILVGVTGAAMAWSTFMHPGAAVLDLFPPGSKFCNEGWGANVVSHFGGLARLSMLEHTCMEHPAALHGSEKPTSEQEARYLAAKEVKEKHGGYWHGQNVRLDMPKFRRVFLEAVDKVLPLRYLGTGAQKTAEL